MADTTLFGRLRRLFSSNIIVRNVGGNRLKIADTDRIQSSGNLSTNYLAARYAGMHMPNNVGGYRQNPVYNAGRLELFADYEAMEQDPILASALDIYSDESTMKNENGDILDIRSDNEQVREVLHNLFYDVINIEFNLWPWIRSMNKYGDFFLKLDIAEKYGVVGVEPMSAYSVSREEGVNPDLPHEVTFNVDDGNKATSYNKNDQTLKNYEVAHFRMLTDSNFLPYGKSMIEAARKIWKQLTLMEDAMLIHRIMRAPEKRIFKIDIGNIPPAEVDNYMQTLINKMKKTPYIDQNSGEYNLKFNMMNMMEDFYLPVRGGDSGTQIESLSGMEYNAIDDVEYLRNKMMAALRIPKAFLGYDEGIEGKATLAQEDVRFARTIERIQRIVLSELTKIAIVHLYTQGFDKEDLVGFELNLTNPSIVYEQEKVALWSEKINLAESMKGTKLISEDWIYKNIFNMTKDQVDDERARVIDDIKQNFRKEQIETEGNDPAVTKESFGTPHDLASMHRKGENEMPEGGWPGGGRPKEGTKYSTDGHPRGRDPIGKKALDKTFDIDTSIKHNFKGNSPLAKENKNNIVNNIIDSLPNDKKILIEKTEKEKITKKSDEQFDLMNEDKVILSDKDMKLK
jgi:hypothetical protein